MPALDTNAKAAVENHFAPAYYLFLDISGDPLRVTTYGADTTFSGTGDSDLDGNTFAAFGGSLLDVGDISNTEGGSETMSVTLSGIIDMDSSLLNDIGNTALWQGRLCRIWCQVYDESGATPIGAIFPLYTGYMSSVGIAAAPEGQTIQLNVENYLAFFSAASNRSYLNQKDYDAADMSAAATLAASNGLRRETGAGRGVGVTIGSGLSGGGTGGGLTGGGIGGSYGGIAGDGTAKIYESLK